MATPQLPQTTIRLATGSSLYVLQESAISLGSFFTAIFQPRSQTNSILNSMQQLYGVVSFGEDQSRTTESRWEIDSDIRGEPIQVLGSPVTRSLKMRRAVLYSGDTIEALGYTEAVKDTSTGLADGGLLAQQLNFPFIIIKRDVAPSGSGVAPTVTFYRHCNLATVSLTANVEGAGQKLGVFEDSTITYAERQIFTT